jgi:hypothetical protein
MYIYANIDEKLRYYSVRPVSIPSKGGGGKLQQVDCLLLHHNIRRIPAFLIQQLFEGAAEEQGDTHQNLQGL